MSIHTTVEIDKQPGKRVEQLIDDPLNKKLGLTKNAVINAFYGVHFNPTQWQIYLADPPEWLKPCRVEKGYKNISATWNPVLIALALLAKGVPETRLDATFVKLPQWTQQWNAELDILRN